MWCIVKGDTAIKGRELLVVEEPSPVACIAHNIFGETPKQTPPDLLVASCYPLCHNANRPSCRDPNVVFKLLAAT